MRASQDPGTAQAYECGTSPDPGTTQTYKCGPPEPRELRPWAARGSVFVLGGGRGRPGSELAQSLVVGGDPGTVLAHPLGDGLGVAHEFVVRCGDAVGIRLGGVRA